MMLALGLKIKREIMSKFKHVSIAIDEDTKIIFELETTLGDYDVLYQKRYWDGITAESIIFSI